MRILSNSIVVITLFFELNCVSPYDPDLTFIFYNYLVITPQNYAEQDSVPLIIFLHGRGASDANINEFKSYGIGLFASQNEDFPFILVAPQNPSKYDWQIDAVNSVLNSVIAKYKIDENRIYLTGYSLGGYATYLFAFKYPDRFAAIAPVAGWGEPENVCTIKDVPIWIFHDSGDPIVPFFEAERMEQAIEECGVNVEFTVFNDSTHAYWDKAYLNSDLYDWFLSYTNLH